MRPASPTEASGLANLKSLCVGYVQDCPCKGSEMDPGQGSSLRPSPIDFYASLIRMEK